MTTPVRLQLSRKKGFNLQAHSRAVNGLPAINCARPSKWGNPYRVGEPNPIHPDADENGKGGPPMTAEDCVSNYMFELRVAAIFPAMLDDVRGKNLACFCPLDQPCHVDALLEAAQWQEE